MADQIEQMGITIETYQKVIILVEINIFFVVLAFVTNGQCFKQQLEELQDKYNIQAVQCSDLSKKLDSTEVRFTTSCEI